MQPLKGKRVLDMTRVLAGPLCTQTLGSLGAEVVKIESVGDGDEMRQWPPYRNGTGTSFLAYNRNKLGIALDLKRGEAIEIVRRLVRGADVFVESGSTGAFDRLGLGYEDLKEIKPDLIYCSISGFGRQGPLRHAKGYDLMLQAFTGMLAMTGEPGMGPVRSPYSPVDQMTGHHAVIGILSALLNRSLTGGGALVEVSLLETATNLLGYHLQAYWENGKLPERVGCGHPSLVPYQPFQAADKPVLIGVANDALWRAFCAEFGLDDLVSDPRFATNGKRVENRDACVAIVQDLVKDMAANPLIDRLIARGIPCSPINTVADLARHDQLAELGMFLSYEHPSLGALRAVAQPVTFDGIKEAAGLPPPRLGEHTELVLQQLGLTNAEIRSLIASGAGYAADPLT